jgi:hypothetical protein
MHFVIEKANHPLSYVEIRRLDDPAEDRATPERWREAEELTGPFQIEGSRCVFFLHPDSRDVIACDQPPELPGYYDMQTRLIVADLWAQIKEHLEQLGHDVAVSEAVMASHPVETTAPRKVQQRLLDEGWAVFMEKKR